jgi:hypothetical protein
MRRSFACYRELFDTLDVQVKANPAIVRLPPGADEKVADRLRKNYALDRARYFIPFATKTNVALVMTARVWADTIRQLDALPLPEAHACAEGLRSELQKFTPRLLRHSQPDEASIRQSGYQFTAAIDALRKNGLPTGTCPDDVFVALENSAPPFFAPCQTTAQAFDGKINRYSIPGPIARRMFMRAAWNNMAIAELRDLNRHRSGYRFSPLVPAGFYLPPGVSHPDTAELLDAANAFAGKLAAGGSAPAYVYALHLGTQVAFEHSTHLDKFIYEIELRTGMGAHFRYAEHLNAACRELLKLAPELAPFITVGTAEPE